jgi:hypothetical protein
MRSHVWPVIAFLLVSILCRGQEQSQKASPPIQFSPPVELWDLLKSNPSILTRVEDLPESVKVALAKVVHQRELAMANPGQRWSSGCENPGTRLIFAGQDEDHSFVFFESGGVVLNLNLVAFKTRKEGTRPIWVATGTVRARNLEELRTAIAEEKFYALPLRDARSE